MKKLFVSLLIATVITGCNKSASNDTATDDPEPVADFRVKNTVETGTVMEGAVLDLENKSLNADTYEWDFDNGTVSSERSPAGVVFRQCTRTYQVRLTVRTRRGRTATIIQTIRVRCR